MHEESVKAENKEIDIWICKSLVSRIIQDAGFIDQLKFFDSFLYQMKALATTKFKEDFASMDFCNLDQID